MDFRGKTSSRTWVSQVSAPGLNKESPFLHLSLVSYFSQVTSPDMDIRMDPPRRDLILPLWGGESYFHYSAHPFPKRIPEGNTAWAEDLSSPSGFLHFTSCLVVLPCSCQWALPMAQLGTPAPAAVRCSVLFIGA